MKEDGNLLGYMKLLFSFPSVGRESFIFAISLCMVLVNIKRSKKNNPPYIGAMRYKKEKLSNCIPSKNF